MEESKNYMDEFNKQISYDLDMLDKFVVEFKEKYTLFVKNKEEWRDEVLNIIKKLESFAEGKTEHDKPFLKAMENFGYLLKRISTKDEFLSFKENFKSKITNNIEEIIDSFKEMSLLGEELYDRMYYAIQKWATYAEAFLKVSEDALQNKKSEFYSVEDSSVDEDDYIETNKKKIGLKIASFFTIILIVVGILEGSILTIKGLMVLFAYLIIGVLLQKNFFEKTNRSFFDYLFFVIHFPSIILTIIYIGIIGSSDNNEAFSDKTINFLQKCENFVDKKIQENNQKNNDYDFTIIDDSGYKRELKYYEYVGPGTKRAYKDELGDIWYTDDYGKHFYKK